MYAPVKIYLAGPIKDCTDDQCIPWREQIALDLSDVFGIGIKILDPMRRDYRKTKVADKDLVEHDKLDIGLSDIVIAKVVPVSVGTTMEVLLAWQLNKFVVIYLEGDNGENLSPWIKYHSHSICQFESEVIDVVTAYIKDRT